MSEGWGGVDGIGEDGEGHADHSIQFAKRTVREEMINADGVKDVGGSVTDREVEEGGCRYSGMKE